MRGPLLRVLGAVAVAGMIGTGIYSVLPSSSHVATPTPVPAANANGVTVGAGFVRSSSRQIVRTPGGTVYVFAVDDNVCQSATAAAILRAYKGSGAQTASSSVPTSFAEVDSAHHPVAGATGDCTTASGSMLEDPDVRVDASGVAQLAYIDESNGDVYYQTFDTSSDTWGSRSVIATNGSTLSGASWPRTGQTGLTIDANGKVWIAWATTGAANAIQYSTNTSGSFSVGANVATGTNVMHPSLVTAADGTVELAWLNNALAAHGSILWASNSGSGWSTTETVSSGDASVLANGDDDQSPAIAVDPSNRPVVLYMDGTVSGADDDVRVRYRASANTWTDNTPPGGNGGASNASSTLFAHTPGMYVAGNGAFYPILGHDVNIQFGYEYQSGGEGTSWAAYATLDPRSATSPGTGDTCEPGLDGAASIRYDPVRDTDNGIIDVAYYDERDNATCTQHHATVYYKAILIP
jgi:hypothetical protein